MGTVLTRPLYSFLVILCLGPLDTAHRVVADRVHLAEVVAQVESVDPGMVMLDPWSAIRDDEAKEYLETFDGPVPVLSYVKKDAFLSGSLSHGY